MNNKDIIIFDGVCKMCNTFFRWVHKNDNYNVFMFTNFQSEFVKKRMDTIKNTDSIAVILKNGKILRKTRAVEYILTKTKKLYLVKLLLKITPKFISNLFYDIVASTRYGIFGKFDQCPILDQEYKSKFLD